MQLFDRQMLRNERLPNNTTPTLPLPNPTRYSLNADSNFESSDLGEVSAGRRGLKRTRTSLYNQRPTWLRPGYGGFVESKKWGSTHTNVCYNQIR